MKEQDLTAENDPIKKGAFQIARKIFDSELWLSKPSSWLKIWVYILGKVSHHETGNCERGEGFFQWTREISLIGNDITIDQIKKFCAFVKVSSMISTRRSTRGVYIKVLNYNKYQSLDNYKSTTRSTKKALEKHQRSTTIDKNGKNGKNENIAEQSSADIPLLIKAFEGINPACKRMYGNTTQRAACENLIKEFTFDRVLAVIEKTLPRTNKIEYMPTITTPAQLFDKWSALEAGIMKLRGKTEIKNTVAF